MVNSKKRSHGSSRRFTKVTLLQAPATRPSELRGHYKQHKQTLGAKGVVLDAQRIEARHEVLCAGYTPETIEMLRGDEHFIPDSDYTMKDVQGPEEGNWEWVDGNMSVDESFGEAIREVSQIYRLQGRMRAQKRKWQPRKAHEAALWKGLLELLTDAYLSWSSAASKNPEHEARAPETPASEPTEEATDTALNSSEQPAPQSPPQTYPYTVDVYDLFTCARQVTVLRDPQSTSPALDLLRHGYVAKTPERPTVAVAIKTLELLYRLRQRCPSLSVEAFTKTVLDYYSIPFRKYLRTLFADTFELYSLIIRNVDKRVHARLGWDTPDWRPLNACQACCYKLEDEPPLTFSRMYAMDGNSSLKRVAMFANKTAGDTRVLDDSSYFLSADFVDRFAHEVRGRRTKNRTVRKRNAGDSSDDDDDDGNVSESGSVEGDPTDGIQDSSVTATTPDANISQSDGPSGPAPSAMEMARAKQMEACVKNWKSAASEEKKRMWGIFDEAGIFASACRHGFILWVADMIRSGELAKYPLAIVAKVLQTIGPNTLGGYDIGCTAESTVKNSSLGPEFTQKNSRFCVNAFHGYTHSHICQLFYHPNIIEGMGIEDLETLERLFSSTNRLATITRYMSPFRRRLYIEAYFKQIDEDKHLNIGMFILNNYTQALDIIETGELTIAQAFQDQEITEELISQWEREETEYFATLGDEATHDVHAVAYVELLQRLRELERKKTQTHTRFLSFTPDDAPSNYAQQAAATRRIETERRHAAEQFDRTLYELTELEVQIGVTARWTPETPEYRDAVQYLQERKYHRALNKLHRLVVQRIFELHKLNVAQTGYKMRTHLSKSLQVRCKTIRKAITAYNAAATACNPPRPTVDWSQVSHYGFLDQFTLLQDTRNDVRERRWTKPAVRETVKLYRRIARAREELTRLNVEVRRVHTAILDEATLFKQVLEHVPTTDPMHEAVRAFSLRREGINRFVLQCINQVYALPGFTGIKGPGTRLGAGERADPPVVHPATPTGTADDTAGAPADGNNDVLQEDAEDEIGEGIVEDEDAGEEIFALVSYISELAVT